MKTHIDLDELEKVIDIVYVYISDYSLLFNQLKTTFNDLLLCCLNYHIKLEDIQNDIIENINTIYLNYLNYIKTLEKVVNDYSWLRKKLIESEEEDNLMIKKSDII